MIENEFCPPPSNPAISVVIPVYNSEKYIGACLESVLSQTFKDFELIVVDDCSTDGSSKIIESYIPKFGGRLKFYQNQKNSGSPSEPSNKGIAISRGKYIYVIDNDDLILPDALYILYNYAEKSEADVVHMDKKFEFHPNDDNLFPKPENLRVHSHQQNLVSQPTIFHDDKTERLKKIFNNFYSLPAWHKFVRRDFLIANDIIFPDLKSSSDVGWTMQVIFSAEKLLRIPQPLYIYRLLPQSLSHMKRTPEEAVNFWIEMFVNGINYFENWTSRQKFFLENPQLKWLIFDTISDDFVRNLQNTIFSVPNVEYYALAESKLRKIFGENSTVTAYCLVASTLLKLNCNVLSQKVYELNHTIEILKNNQR